MNGCRMSKDSKYTFSSSCSSIISDRYWDTLLMYRSAVPLNFGLDFQANAVIVLMLDNKKELSCMYEYDLPDVNRIVLKRSLLED